MTRTVANSISRRALLFALSICLYSSADGAPVNHGNHSNIPPGDIMYLDVEEIAVSPGDPDLLYGSPAVVVNTLGFNPTGDFNASSPPLADQTDGQLSFTIMGMNVAITRFQLSGAGNYTLSGTGTAATAVGYHSSITQLNIVAVDGIPVSSPLVLPGVNVSESFDLTGGVANETPWASTLTYDVNAALANAGVTFQYGATQFDVIINNVLDATSETSSTAQIRASSFAFAPITVSVPEPASLALLALGAVVAWRRWLR